MGNRPRKIRERKPCIVCQLLHQRKSDTCSDACKQKSYRQRRQLEIGKLTKHHKKNLSLRLRSLELFDIWISQDTNQKAIQWACGLLTNNAIHPDPVLVIGILRRRADNPTRMGNAWAKPLRQWMNEKGLMRGKGKS
jgi:hypothetical protein